MAILSVSIKSVDLLETYWAPDPSVDYYNIYISRIDFAAGFVILKTKIANQPSTEIQYKGKIHTRITLAEVRAALADMSLTFVDNVVYYFRITSVTSAVETAVALAVTKEIFPVGIGDNGTINVGGIHVNQGNSFDNESIFEQDHGFSWQLQRWVRTLDTKFGARNTFENPLHADDVCVVKTYTVVAGETVVNSELWYFAGTPVGGRAKLVSYSYDGIPFPCKICWSDDYVGPDC